MAQPNDMQAKVNALLDAAYLFYQDPVEGVSEFHSAAIAYGVARRHEEERKVTHG